MDFTGLFEIQEVLFSIAILGPLLKKKSVIRGQSQELSTGLMVYVTLPCSIVRSFEIELDHEILIGCLIILIITLGVRVGSYILSFILYPHVDEGRKEVLQCATICFNVGILSNPITESIFGPLNPLYASIYLILQRIFMRSTRFTYFTEVPDRKILIKKVTTYPYILTAGLGLILTVSGTRPLPVAGQAVKTLASANTALSMLFTGSILARVSFKSLRNRATLYYFLIRLIFTPCLIYLFYLTFHVEPVVTGVPVVLTRMPAASVAAILAAEYKCDAVFTAKCVVSPTLLSIVTTPALCLMVR